MPTDRPRVTLQDEIVRFILDDALKPGDPLPTEVDLMSRLGSSRNSVREALRALQALGIVDIRHGYGTFVGQASLDILHTSLVFRAGLAGEQLRIVRNLIDLREVLEAGFIPVVIDRITEHDLARLDDITLRMDEVEELTGAEREFHELLYETCDNPLLLELIRAFWNTYQDVEPIIHKPDEAAASIAASHSAIVALVRARDVEKSVEAVHAHFNEVRVRLERYETGNVAPH